MIKKMSDSVEGTGIFFNIQRLSVHDGPGIRTILFAKGCPLRCLWCSNPESQKFEPELAYKPSCCIGVKQCGLCIDACPQKAIAPQKDGSVTIDRVLCDNCGRCVAECPANSLIFIGKEYTVEELVKKVEEDANFWWRSGGGPTIGGGEPLSQPKFIGRLLEVLKSRGYHTVVDTCGHFDLNAPGIERALKNTNVLLYDIKLMDPVKHKAYTGHSNERILSNILEISRTYPKIEIVARTPVIPGINDTEEDIKEIAIFLRNIPTVKDFELLAYHAFGSPKYAQLGRCYDLNNFKLIDAKKIKVLQELASKIFSLDQLPELSKVETGS